MVKVSGIARVNMIEGQLRPNQVIDTSLLKVFSEVPREDFVPKALQSVAYVDEDLHLGEGRYLLEPMLMGRLYEMADIQIEDVILDIGCATGYSTAILSRLCSLVIGIDDQEKFIDQANKSLQSLEYSNAVFFTHSMQAGYPEHAPYQKIFLNGAVANIPPYLVNQLEEGGKLLTVLRPAGQVGKAVMVEKIAGHCSLHHLFDAHTPYLPGFAPLATFQF